MLTEKVSSVNNGQYKPVVHLLLCLSQLDAPTCDSPHTNLFHYDVPSSRKDLLANHNKEFRYMEYNFSWPNYSSYEDSPYNPFEWMSAESSNYTTPRYQQPVFDINRKSKFNGVDIHGMSTEQPVHKNIIGDHDRMSMLTLYGGLVHSCVSSIDDELSLPELPHNSQIDLCRYLQTNRFVDEDEGFVSTGSTPISERAYDVGNDGLEVESSSDYFFSDDEPYFGYRKPRYDVQIWRDCLNVKLSQHRTWETIGLPTGSTPQRWYLSEAGPTSFDFVWRRRLEIVTGLANALHQNVVMADQITPPSLDWKETGESTLVHHAHLAVVGVASETFVFNTLAHMFLVKDNVYIRGVTPLSVKNLLTQFAMWGTCYWRLLHFSSSATTSSIAIFKEQFNDRGVIFKAFCEGIRSYLHGYQKNILMLYNSTMTLQQLYRLFKKAGAQISYLCRFCQCGIPDQPLSSPLLDNHFPTGVGILTYLYEEAVQCTESNDYLVLLYLLRKCCQPYLHFVQNWVYNGSCWDVTGEFLLRVNNDYGGRRDRRRWSSYVTVENYDDIKSCVPSFLAPVAEDMFICGKTVEFLRLICPEHFLSSHLSYLPGLFITFSKLRMQNLIRLWKKFNDLMLGLERERKRIRKKQQDEEQRSRSDLAVRMQASHDELIEEVRKSEENYRQQLQQMKLEEFQRLKQQAEDDMERRKLLRVKEKEDERQFQEEAFLLDTLSTNKQNEMLEKAKNEIISHYDALSNEAERRKEKADWKIKRHLLDKKRIDFLKEQEISSDQVKLLMARSVSSLASEGSRSAHDAESNLSVTESVKDSSSQLGGSSLTISNSASVATIATTPHVSDESIPSERVISSIKSSSTHVSDESAPPDTVILSVKPCSNHVSDESASCEPTFKSTRATSSHVSDESSQEVAYVKMRKSSHGHVSVESTFPGYRVKKLKQSQSHVSMRSVGSEAVRSSKKSVGNEHVSKSSIVLGSSSSDAALNLMKEPLVDHTFYSGHVEGNIRTMKKLVEERHVSDSTVNEMMKSDDSGKEHKKSLPGIVNDPRHSSYSTVQNIMYYEEKASQLSKRTTPDDAEVTTPAESSLPESLFTITSSTDLSPASAATEASEDTFIDVISDNSFVLDLPSAGIYDNHVTSTSQRLKSKKTETGSFDLIDLFSSVADDVSGDHDDDDDIMGMSADNYDVTSIDLHALPVLLRNCVLQPIKSHASLVNRCAITFFMEDLRLQQHFDMLRQFLLLEDGEFAQTLCQELFTNVHSGCCPTEVLNPVSLDSIMAQSIHASAMKNSPLTSHLSIEVEFLPPAFSPVDVHVLDCIRLRYHAEWPLNIILTDSCHKKYNKVLSFLLQIKQVVWALQDTRLRLNQICAQRSTFARMTSSEVRMTHIYRHEMHNFVRVMQGYVSTQVLCVCWKEFMDELKTNIRTLEDLHIQHAEYINKCILRCLLTAKAQNVMNVINDVFKSILKFRTHLTAPMSATYVNMQLTYQEFSRLSTFLYKVVLRLVQRGYQPHLEDFLLRLNFNGFYRS